MAPALRRLLWCLLAACASPGSVICEDADACSGTTVLHSPQSTPPLAPGAPLAHSSSVLPLRLEPEYLRYDAWPLCIPQVLRVELVNTHAHEELLVHSVSPVGAAADQFHVAALPSSPVPLLPGGRLPLSVVYLPSMQGYANGTLLMQTSHGGLLYDVSGIGMPSPYKLAPIVSASVPLGAPYRPPFQLHNPHNKPMRITEIFTSESFLHLELPQPDERPPHVLTTEELWQLGPAETRNVVTLNFAAPDGIGRYRGYVHVLTDFDTLIVPVDLTVTPAAVQRIPEMIDFGLLTSAEQTVTRSLSLNSALRENILAMDVTARPAVPSLRLTPGPNSMKLRPPDGRNIVMLMANQTLEITKLTFSGKVQGDFKGELVVTTSSTDPLIKELLVPYTARVVHGAIRVRLPEMNARTLMTVVVTNEFAMPVRLDGLAIADAHYAIKTTRNDADGTPAVLQPGETLEFAKIKMLLDSPRVYNAQLVLRTNATDVHVPLPVYHARLTFAAAVFPSFFDPPPTDPEAAANLGALEGATLPYGDVGVGSPRRALLNISNPNPMPLRIVALEISPSLEGSLRCLLQTIRDEHLHAVKPNGSVALHAALPLTVAKRTVDGKRGGGARAKRDEEAPLVKAASDGAVLFTVPAHGRAILAADMTAATTDEIAGKLSFRLEKLPHARERVSDTLTVDVSANGWAGGLSLITPAATLLLSSRKGKPVRPDATAVAQSLPGEEWVTSRVDPRKILDEPAVREIAASPLTALRQLNFLRVPAGGLFRLPIVVGSDFALHAQVVSATITQRKVVKGGGADASAPSLTPSLIGGQGLALRTEITVPNASVPARKILPIGFVEVDATELFSGGEGVEQLAEPFFHTTPGAPLDSLTANFLVRRRKRWSELEAAGALEYHGTLRVDFELVRNLSVPIHATFVWPSLATTASLAFGATHVDTITSEYVDVHNPSESTVWAQLLEPSDLLQRGLEAEIAGALEFFWLANGGFQYALGAQSKADLEHATVRPEAFRIDAAAKAPIILAPGETARLGPIHFHPRLHGHSRYRLYVRNNLTLLDTVALHGNGASGQLVFISAADADALDAERAQWKKTRPARRQMPLGAYRTKPEHITAARVHIPAEELPCALPAGGGAADVVANPPADGTPPPPRRVLRVFALLNAGDLPVTTDGGDLGGHGCAYGGFTLLDECAKNITLPPGGTVRLTISFEPDFAVAFPGTVPLTVRTSAGSTVLRLRASLPPGALAPCAAERRTRLAAEPAEGRARSTANTLLFILFGVFVQLVVGEFMREPPPPPAAEARSTAQPAAPPAAAAAVAAEKPSSKPASREELKAAKREARKTERPPQKGSAVIEVTLDGSGKSASELAHEIHAATGGLHAADELLRTTSMIEAELARSLHEEKLAAEARAQRARERRPLSLSPDAALDMTLPTKEGVWDEPTPTDSASGSSRNSSRASPFDGGASTSPSGSTGAPEASLAALGVDVPKASKKKGKDDSSAAAALVAAEAKTKAEAAAEAKAKAAAHAAAERAAAKAAAEKAAAEKAATDKAAAEKAAAEREAAEREAARKEVEERGRRHREAEENARRQAEAMEKARREAEATRKAAEAKAAEERARREAAREAKEAAARAAREAEEQRLRLEEQKREEKRILAAVAEAERKAERLAAAERAAAEKAAEKAAKEAAREERERLAAAEREAAKLRAAAQRAEREREAAAERDAKVALRREAEQLRRETEALAAREQKQLHARKEASLVATRKTAGGKGEAIALGSRELRARERASKTDDDGGAAAAAAAAGAVVDGEDPLWGALEPTPSARADRDAPPLGLLHTGSIQQQQMASEMEAERLRMRAALGSAGGDTPPLGAPMSGLPSNAPPIVGTGIGTPSFNYTNDDLVGLPTSMGLPSPLGAGLLSELGGDLHHNPTRNLGVIGGRGLGNGALGSGALGSGALGSGALGSPTLPTTQGSSAAGGLPSVGLAPGGGGVQGLPALPGGVGTGSSLWGGFGLGGSPLAPSDGDPKDPRQSNANAASSPNWSIW